MSASKFKKIVIDQDVRDGKVLHSLELFPSDSGVVIKQITDDTIDMIALTKNDIAKIKELV